MMKPIIKRTLLTAVAVGAILVAHLPIIPVEAAGLGPNGYSISAITAVTDGLYCKLTGCTLTGNFVVNRNSAGAPTPLPSQYTMLVGADGASPGYVLYGVANGSAIVPAYSIMWQGGTLAAKTAIPGGIQLGQYNMGGYDGTNLAAGTSIRCFASATNWSGSNHGAYCEWYTTQDGSTTQAATMRVGGASGLDVQVVQGGLDVPKLGSAPAAGPGAGYLRVFAVAGTNAGSCKIQLQAGTSATAATLQDNVGSGC